MAPSLQKTNQKGKIYYSRSITKSKFYLLPLGQRDKEFDAQIKQFYHYLVLVSFNECFLRIVITQALILLFKAY